MVWKFLVSLENGLPTLFCPSTINAHFFVAKMIWAHFFVAKTIYAHFFVAKTIYALRPESFCALKVAIRKVQTFWASAEVAPLAETLSYRIWYMWYYVAEAVGDTGVITLPRLPSTSSYCFTYHQPTLCRARHLTFVPCDKVFFGFIAPKHA